MPTRWKRFKTRCRAELVVTRAAWRPYWRFAKDHTVLFIAMASVLGALTYLTLASAEQHMYGSLYLDLADVGLSRPRLIEDTAVATALIALIFVPVVLLLSLIFMIEPATPRFAVWRPAGAVLSAVALGFITLGLIWGAASLSVSQIRSGKIASGTFSWGLQILDLWAMPFHFTRLPPGHGFDRSCVLYLGHANGQLVMYDVERATSLRLPESQYAGEAEFVGSGQVPDRCLSKDDSTDVVATADRIEDVDAAGRTIVWSERAQVGDPWDLMARIGDREQLLVESHRRIEPDLGRDERGGLLVTYRSCTRRLCVIRRRAMSRDHSISTIGVPHARTCTPAWPSESQRITAVVLGGARCAASHRGVWVRRPGKRWRHITTTRTGAAELDTLAGDVVWVEHRGPLDRIRSMRGYGTNTIASGEESLSAPRMLKNGGIMWWREGDALTGFTWRQYESCDEDAPGVRGGADDVGHFAPSDQGLLVAERSAIVVAGGKTTAAYRRLSACVTGQ